MIEVGAFTCAFCDEIFPSYKSHDHVSCGNAHGWKTTYRAKRRFLAIKLANAFMLTLPTQEQVVDAIDRVLQVEGLPRE